MKKGLATVLVIASLVALAFSVINVMVMTSQWSEEDKVSKANMDAAKAQVKEACLTLQTELGNQTISQAASEIAAAGDKQNADGLQSSVDQCKADGYWK
jgi:uncharacterized membrane protein